MRYRSFVSLCLSLLVVSSACSDRAKTSESVEVSTTLDSQRSTTSTDPAATTTTIPLGDRFCANAGEPRQTGSLVDPALLEVSGVVASRRDPGVFWVHNDSGDQARVFAIDETGARLGEFVIDGVDATDWEDIALVPGKDGDELVVADIGDNAAQRVSVRLLHIPEPDLPEDPAQPVTVAGLESVEYVYDDGPHDAESLFYDVVSGELYVVSKAYVGAPRVYATREREPGVFFAGPEVALGAGSLATAADATHDGSAILVRTYTSVLVFPRAAGESADAALAKEPCVAPSATEQQGESIAALADGSGYITISEGAGAPIWKVTVG
jgi:hypothetical protein